MLRSEMVDAVARAGFPALVQELPTSQERFEDGRAWRIEIPSCEGPRVMAEVLEAAEELDVPVHRVSQGSGVMMLRDAEIRDMVQMGADRDVEVNLFIGPRAAWDVGAQAKVTAAVGGAARGNEMVAASMAEARRAVDLGIRSLLVGDLGTLSVLGTEKAQGRLPKDLVLKTSVVLPLTNGPTAAVYEQVGATSLNVSTDLSLAHLAEIRQAAAAAIDIYVEAPDDQGGAVRYYDVPELVRVAAPVYLKVGLRNAPNIYPSGQHLGAVPASLGRERVRRAALMLELLRRQRPDLG